MDYPLQELFDETVYAEAVGTLKRHHRSIWGRLPDRIEEQRIIRLAHRVAVGATSLDRVLNRQRVRVW